DRNLRREGDPARAERVDREAVVRRVHGEEPVSRGREREGAYVAALEVDERAGASGGGGHQDRQDGENACDHAVSPPGVIAPRAVPARGSLDFDGSELARRSRRDGSGGPDDW